MNRLIVFITTLPGIASAAVVTDFQTSSANQTNYPVSSTDLINLASTALSQYSQSGYVASPIDSYGPISALIDGDGGGITGFIPSPGGVMDLDGTWSFQVDLDIGNCPLGYDITSIQTFTGHTDNRKSQSYTLYASLVGDVTFFQIGDFTFDFNNQNPGSTRLTISDSTGVIASGVDSLRWDVRMPSSGFATVYREFDVFGFSTVVPEPSTMLLWTTLVAISVACVTRRKSSHSLVSSIQRFLHSTESILTSCHQKL